MTAASEAAAQAHVAWAAEHTPWRLTDEQLFRLLLDTPRGCALWRRVQAEANRRAVEVFQ